MTILRTSPVRSKSQQSAAPPAWLLRPVDGVGFCSIGGTAYRVEEVHYHECDGTPRMLVRLRKPDGTEYQLVPVEGSLSCDCPHAVYRDCPTACKHARAVTELYEQLDREERLAAFLAPDAVGVIPLDCPF